MKYQTVIYVKDEKTGEYTEVGRLPMSDVLTDEEAKTAVTMMPKTNKEKEKEE